VKGYMDEVAKVVDVLGFSAMCDTDYAIKITYANGDVFALFGYNMLSKTYAYRTSCCPMTACDECDKVGSASELAAGLAAQINLDPDKLATASLFAWKIGGTVTGTGTAANADVTVGTTHFTVPILAGDTPTQAAAKIVAQINTQAGSPYRASNTGAALSIYPITTTSTNTDTLAITGAGLGVSGVTAATKTSITDPAAFRAAYPDASAGIRVTGSPSKRAGWNGNIPVKYVKAGLDFDVSLTDGLGRCNGTTTVVTEPVYPEGKGEDLQKLEYDAGGWNGKPGPYRAFNGLGLQKTGYEFFTTKGANYNTVSLAYDQFSVAGWIEHLNNLETIIAIPCADTVTLTGLFAVLDEVFDDVIKMSDDVASMDCTNVVTSALTPATDGIESLS